tara:strand:- start:6097 stop:6771 length:675 start_codon:yes stop_codon:yes gene_type:complete
MKTIHLHGKIGKMFGEKWLLDVDSVTEALRAIDANVGGFFDYLLDNLQENKTFSFLLDSEEHTIQSKEELIVPLPKKCKEFHIIPNAEGALTAFVTSLVVSLASGFIMRALFKPPKPEEERQSKSFLFSGGENVAQQGAAVPLGYGRLLVGSVVASATMEHIDRHRVDTTSDVSTSQSHVRFFKNLGNVSKYQENLGDTKVYLENTDPVGVFSLDQDSGGGAGG